jgi:hypothetical protein
MARSQLPLRMSFIRRLLNPTPAVLFAVAALTFAGAVITGQHHFAFLMGAEASDGEIIRVETPSQDYSRYAVRLLALPDKGPHGIVESDRRNLTPGVTMPVLYLRDYPNRIISIELFVPWTRPIWLITLGLAALALGLRERDRLARHGPKPDTDTGPTSGEGGPDKEA